MRLLPPILEAVSSQTWRFMPDGRTSTTVLFPSQQCVPLHQNSKKLKAKNFFIKRAPLSVCKVSNEEIQTDFGGTIFRKKTQKVSCIYQSLL